MRQLSQEQIEKRDARRAAFRALVKTVGNMSADERLKFQARVGAITTASGGVIGGLTNTMLLMMQIPNVTMVGGFKQWLAVGRCVKKGEHGAMIWVPIGRGKKPETVMDAPAEGSAELDRPGFVIGTVFDISQTQEIETGKPITAIALPDRRSDALIITDAAVCARVDSLKPIAA